MLTRHVTIACKRAQRLARKRGIHGTERIYIYADPLSAASWCFAEPIKIAIGWMHMIQASCDLPAVTQVIAHEYAHAMSFQLWPKLKRAEIREWEAVFGKFEDEGDPYESPWTYAVNRVTDYLGVTETALEYNVDTHVSAYAKTSAQEDWAETVSHVIVGKRIRRAPVLNKKLEIIKKNIVRHQQRC